MRVWTRRGESFYKATNGIKRHLAVDTLGFPCFTHCTKANVSDDAGLLEMLTLNIDYFQSKPHDEVRDFFQSTSELGAEKFGVSPATIERDAQYKRAVDAICCLQRSTERLRPELVEASRRSQRNALASLGGVQLRTLLLSGEISLKKAELIALGKQVHLCPKAVEFKLGIALDLLENPNQENFPLDSTFGANDSPTTEEPTASDSDLALAHHLKLSGRRTGRN